MSEVVLAARGLRKSYQSGDLGIEVDEDMARAHPYTGTGLHLEMQEAPCDYVNGNRFEGGAPAPKE